MRAAGALYLRPAHLAGFDTYKYHAIDTSPLSVYVMHPFWNKCVELFPRWVAPNVLTFAGFLLTVFDFLLISYYDYEFYAASNTLAGHNATDVPATLVNGKTTIPSWCWLAMSLFLFLAYTLDGIDGKQARRTQTSGPLGELFDHGLDSYSVFFIPVCLYSAFGRLDYSQTPLRMYFILWNILLSFYVSHWEKYNTGVLFLPWGYDFSMWGGIAVFLVTGLKGTSYWRIHGPGGFTPADYFEITIYATTFLANVPVSAYNVYKSYKLRSGVMRSPLEALRPGWSLLAVFTISTVWVLRSPSNIVDKDPRMVYLMMGTVFSNFTCRLIVSQMSGQRCEFLCWLVWPLTAAAALSVYVPAYEMSALYAFTAFCVLAHVHYGTCVVRQMCQHFRIACFYIKKRTD